MHYIHLFFLIGFLLVTNIGSGQTIPAGGTPLHINSRYAAQNFTKDSLGSITVTGSGQDAQFRFTTDIQPQFTYNLSRRIPLRKQALEEGQMVLVSFRAKTEWASLETGEAKLALILKQSDSHKTNISKTLSLSHEWRTYYLPFQMTQDVNKEHLALSVHFGYPPQAFLVEDLQILSFPIEVQAEQLPKTAITYAGRENDATWRIEALERIERIRKGNFSLQFVNEAGEILTNARINVHQTRHAFGWGAAINAKHVLSEGEHLTAIKKAFNQIVFENDLKFKHWVRQGKAAITLDAIQQLQANQIDIKGHVLVWPGFRHLPPIFRQWENQPQRVQQRIAQHLSDILTATEGQITHWDVVNEAYTNRDLQRITGSETILYDAFSYLKEVQPNVGRYTNEFGIISRGGHDQQKQQWYYEYIQRIDQATNGGVDGIGIQCHIGSDLTPPEKVLTILDYYGQLDKSISISEFTLDVDDPELRFDYTRDFIIAAFSHPQVSEMLFWGYYQPSHPKASIYNADWTFGDMGLAYFHLVHELWNTQISATTDGGGRLQGRGYYGEYEYTIEHQGQTYTGNFELIPGEVLLGKIVVSQP